LTRHSSKEVRDILNTIADGDILDLLHVIIIAFGQMSPVDRKGMLELLDGKYGPDGMDRDRLQ
jgi:hypothetical protein